MVSTLRCAGFSGFLVVGYGNRFLGTLADAMKGFEGLLDSM